MNKYDTAGKKKRTFEDWTRAFAPSIINRKCSLWFGRMIRNKRCLVSKPTMCLGLLFLFVLSLHHSQRLGWSPFHVFKQRNQLPFEYVNIADKASELPRNSNYSRELEQFLNIVIQDYNVWHREQRHLSERHPSFAQSLRLLVFRGNRNFGLGDRFKGLLHAYLAAVATERLFLIDLPQPFPLHDVLNNPPTNNYTYDPEVFRLLPNEEAVKSEGDLPDLIENPSRVVFQTGQPNLRVAHFLQIPKVYPQLQFSQNMKRVGLESFEAGCSDVVPFVLRSLFKVSPSLRRVAMERDPFQGQPYLASHARFGKGVKEECGRFNMERYGLSLRSISICFGRMVGMTAKHAALDKIFLATDTANATEWIKQGIHEELSGATVASLQGQVAHINKLRSGRQRGERSNYEEFERAFLDLALMSRGRALVALNSGFARLGAWMGAYHDRDTIMVSPKVCPLLGIGTGVHCIQDERHSKISVRTLMDEKLAARWKIRCNSLI